MPVTDGSCYQSRGLLVTDTVVLPLATEVMEPAKPVPGVLLQSVPISNLLSIT